MAQQVSIKGTAENNGGYVVRPFHVRQKIVFIANDSDTYDLEVNLDATTDQAGTFTLKPGEAVSDLPTTCTGIALSGVGGSVSFRALGV